MTDAPSTPRDAARTRERILSAARREFSRSGFARTTVRSVAAAAAVSPNLITRYFGGKEGLFAAAVGARLGVESMFAGPRESLGRRMAATILARWATTGAEDPLLVLLRAAGERGETAELLAEFLDRESLEPLRRQLLAYGMAADEADVKAQGIDVFLLGVSARHRLLRRDLGDAASEEAWIARTVQAIVDAP